MPALLMSVEGLPFMNEYRGRQDRGMQREGGGGTGSFGQEIK